MITGGPHDRTPRLPPQTVALLPLLFVFLFGAWLFRQSLLEQPVTEVLIECEFPTHPAHDRLDSPDTLTIEIRLDDTISIAGILTEPLGNHDLPALRQHLSARREAINTHGGLIVSPHPEIPMQRLIDVISAVKRSGISFYALH